MKISSKRRAGVFSSNHKCMHYVTRNSKKCMQGMYDLAWKCILHLQHL